MITQELLKEFLYYDKSTGLFTWINKTSVKSRVEIGSLAGYLNVNGYMQIRLFGITYYSHRLAFLYETGEWPNEVDHINSIRNDNKWLNLRTGDHSCNMQNQKKCTTYNTSTKLLGCSFHKLKKKFISHITIKGKLKHLGYFDTAMEAHQAYLAAKRQIHEFNTL